MKKVIVITGDLAAGKSTLAQRLGKKLGCFSLTKDTLKEIISDEVLFSTREENKRISNAAVQVMIHLLKQDNLFKEVVILEANFHKSEVKQIMEICNEKAYKLVLVYLTGDVDLLYERFCFRIKHENRHITHQTADLGSLTLFKEYLVKYRDELKEFDFHIINVKKDNYDEVYDKAQELLMRD